MVTLYCPHCGSSDMTQGRAAWLWDCPGCYEQFVLIPIPQVPPVRMCFDGVMEYLPQAAIDELRAHAKELDDKGVSL